MEPGERRSEEKSGWHRFVPKPTYANVMSTIAVFLALSGVAYATGSLPGLSVGTKQLKPKAVKTGKIANRAVGQFKIRRQAIHRNHLNPPLLASLMGAVGPTGATGAQGMPGTDGAPGAVGPIGATGVTGAQGSTGPTGADGLPGLDGSPGTDGATGATGPAGVTGATGVTGASGVADIQYVSEYLLYENLPAGNSNSRLVVCPNGYIAIAGGFATTPGVLQTFQSYPDRTGVSGPFNAWRMAVVNPTNATQTGGSTAYVVCVPG